MFDSFLTFINRLGLDLKQQQTILTVSGGVDSVVMAHLFYRAGYKASIAHCNFGLRGEESHMDEEFVRTLSEAYGFPFFIKHFDTKYYARTHGISTQMAARDLRYTWFEEIRKDQFDWIATAHHVNDSLETALLNFTRGTGIAGVRGIRAINGVLLRPLLFATKEEISQYAAENRLSWREDRSNESLDYKRNVIRKKVVPVLKELNASLESTFQVTSEKISAADSLLSVFLTDWQQQVVSVTGDGISIPISALKGQHENGYLLWSILDTYGFNYIQSKQICTSLDCVSGSSFYSASHQLLKERTHLIVRKRKVALSEQEWGINGPGEYRVGDESFLVEESETCMFSKDKDTIYLDASKIVFPLKIRNWRPGDIFFPFGMKGKKKKVSDVLVDLKYSMYQKEHVKVLVNQKGEIIWLVGIRADERWRVGESATGFYKITRTISVNSCS